MACWTCRHRTLAAAPNGLRRDGAFELPWVTTGSIAGPPLRRRSGPLPRSFTEPVRPKTGIEQPGCARCEATFGREPFPKGTRFKFERELASATRDLDAVPRLRDAVDRALRLLEFSPYSCRKAARAVNDKKRELIIPFGSAGLIAAFEVRGDVVRIGAIRHQLAQDYH